MVLRSFEWDMGIHSRMWCRQKCRWWAWRQRTYRPRERVVVTPCLVRTSCQVSWKYSERLQLVEAKVIRCLIVIFTWNNRMWSPCQCPQPSRSNRSGCKSARHAQYSLVRSYRTRKLGWRRNATELGTRGTLSWAVENTKQKVRDLLK